MSDIASPDLTLPASICWSHTAFDGLAKAGLFNYGLSFSEIVAECRGRLCYLATPYSKLAVDDRGDWDLSASVECSVRAARCARALAGAGVTAISPIVQAVEMVHADIIRQELDPLDDDFWTNWCRPLLRTAHVVIVPDLPGWAESNGVWAEVRAALNSNRRVFLMNVSETFEGAA